MNGFWYRSAIARRNGNAIFMAISLLGILIGALVLKNQEASRQLLKTETVISTITDVKKYSRVRSTRHGDTVFEMYKYRIKLPDGKEIEIIMGAAPVIPKVNDKIPVIVSYYSDDKKEYRINNMEWLLYH